MCLPAPYLPIRTTALPLSFTHIRAAGLWFSGSYDTIQILLAAYSREMCFVQSSFPTKSRFSLRCSFDPHGTRGLCQQSCVSAGGTADRQDVIELISGTALPLRGAVTHHILNRPPLQGSQHPERQVSTHIYVHGYQACSSRRFNAEVVCVL